VVDLDIALGYGINMKKKAKNPKIKYSKKSTLDKDEFDPRYRKVSIFLTIPGDVVDTYLELSAIHGLSYKKLMVEDLKTIVRLENDHRRKFGEG
jgi:hypothetical protein